MFKVYKEKEREAKKPKPVFLRLNQGGGGGVNLVAVDDEGRAMATLMIFKNGRIVLCPDIGDALDLNGCENPFPLDDKGRLLI